MWKTILEEVFDDLLRFLFSYADKEYDLHRGFEFLDKELAKICPEADKPADTRIADKLVKVYTRDGKEEWILIHVEIQGDTSKKEGFAERMFRYFYRILDKYHKPVSAVAIFTGRHGQTMPNRYEYSCGGTSLIYRYHTLSILDYSEEGLWYLDNPFAIVLMAARTALLKGTVPEQFLQEKKLLIARQLLQKNIPANKVRAIFAFLDNYIHLEDATLNLNFTQQVEHLDHKNYNMGIIEYLQQEAREEGLKTGQKEERERLTRSLLEKSELSVTKIANLIGVSTYFVNKIKKQLRLN
ncbi:MAG TPA: hypothetical protein VHC96_13610 [Puia sp.]|nr:hypothetical protein [Puia sp.]